MSPSAPDSAASAPSPTSRSRAPLLFHSRFLKLANLSIAVLIVLIVAAVYWFGWRTLPETSGSISAPISAQATVARDARGVPHISAATWQDVIFLQGYVTAQDRIWQMDALRRLAGGELAEVLGRGAMDSILESDRDAKRWRLERIAEAQERALTPEARAVFAAYARGVNFYLETHVRRLPPEFTLLGYDPRPWRIADSLLVALQMGRTLTGFWREKMNKLQMLESGDAAAVNFLYPRRIGGEVLPGSNAWVISGARSVTGKPILANDPHLEWSIPGAWHLVHLRVGDLRAGDLDVTGASLPGIPAVIVGHNRRIAWGVTNLGFEVQDLYREQIDSRTGAYLFEGRMQRALAERDIIAVKGSPPIPVDNWITRHGPIFVSDGSQSYSMRWVAAENEAMDFGFLALDRARNWNEFNAALERFAWPGQNAVYADVDGNIGYHATGRLPVRRADCPSDIPQDGASGKCEWQGFIPYDKLPQAFNPASGIIVTANQNPFPADYPWPVDGVFAPKYRAQEIRALLGSRAQWPAADMVTIEKDVYSAFGDFLAHQIIAAWDRYHPASKGQMTEAIRLLRGWNGQMEIGSAPAMIVELTYEQFLNMVAESVVKGRGSVYETSLLAPEVIEKLLRERPEWFEDYDGKLLVALNGAISTGTKLQGSKLSRWNYGVANRLKIESPVFGRLPLIAKYFNIGPVPMSGSGNTIKQINRRLGPSLRMVVNLADLDQSLENLAIGESGHPLSRHYSDQWNAHYNGRSFPMEFDKVEATQVLTVNPQ